VIHDTQVRTIFHVELIPYDKVYGFGIFHYLKYEMSMRYGRVIIIIQSNAWIGIKNMV
jgi:hypothetical protein